MKVWGHWILASVAAVMFMAQGCETAGPARPSQWIPVPIANVAEVAGKWEGLMTRSPHGPRDDDWVRVSIGEDGTVHFASYRTIGVFSGTGRVVLEDGKLVASGERGRVTCVLYAAAGERRMLKAIGTTTDGLEYSAELTPAQ